MIIDLMSNSKKQFDGSDLLANIEKTILKQWEGDKLNQDNALLELRLLTGLTEEEWEKAKKGAYLLDPHQFTAILTLFQSITLNGGKTHANTH